MTSGMTLGLRVNVANLFNSQSVVSYGSGEGSTFFRQAYGRQYPRWVQLQATSGSRIASFRIGPLPEREGPFLSSHHYE